jgi:DNA-directed RNA polymerase specialized sigma subunit
MDNSNNDRDHDSRQVALVSELKEIKKLLVLLLLKGGATQTEIAKALNATQGTVSKQFRFGNVKRLAVEVGSDGEG